MAKYCVGCQKEHEDFNWIYKTYEVESGDKIVKKDGWFCREWHTPSRMATPERIKDQRIKHAKDIVQPHRKGQPSKEFIDLYPKQAKKMFTKKEVKNAKNVWKGDLKGLD